MKHKICCVLALVLICTRLLTVTSFAAYLPGDTVVYITEYGSKYHNDGCGALWNSRYKITLADAVARGYTRCDRCWPGLLDPDWQSPEPSPSPKPLPKPSPTPKAEPSPSTSMGRDPSGVFFRGIPYMNDEPERPSPSHATPSPRTSSSPSTKEVKSPTDLQMVFAILGFCLMASFCMLNLIMFYVDKFKRKRAEREERNRRNRALEQERQEMILRRTREAEAKRLAEQQAIERQHQEEEARRLAEQRALERQRQEEEAKRIAEQQAIEQQRRKEEITRLAGMLYLVKRHKEEKDRLIAEQRFIEPQRQEEAKHISEMEALELRYHEENVKLLEEQRAMELQYLEKEAEFLVKKRAIAKSLNGKATGQKKGRRRTYEEKRAEYAEIYGGVPAEQLAGVPMWVEIGPDGLPKERGAHGLGDYFTYYITAHGKCIHKKQGCCGAHIPIHVLNARARFMSYCSKCCPWPYPDLRWYSKYLKIKQIKQKYNID